ncbi:UNVERIFIED_CONTAM: hypothetical protein O8I53_07675 [Campylobacter lari]
MNIIYLLSAILVPMIIFGALGLIAYFGKMNLNIITGLTIIFVPTLIIASIVSIFVFSN